MPDAPAPSPRRSNPGVFQLWAKSSLGSEPTRRWFGDRLGAVDRAEWIARQSAPEGAVSVWVEDPAGEVIWAAGEKATELNWSTYEGAGSR